MTAIADSHLEFLGDRAGVLRAKAEIFETMSSGDLAVLNATTRCCAASFRRRGG